MSRKRVTKRQPYSEEQKAEALVALERNEGNLYRTSKETGIKTGTLHRWAHPESAMTLDERLEHLAYQLVAAMPEKLDGANLHQIIEALKFVLDKIGRAEEEKRGDVYEKLARLIDRYAAEKAANGDSEPTDTG